MPYTPINSTSVQKKRGYIPIAESPVSQSPVVQKTLPNEPVVTYSNPEMQQAVTETYPEAQPERQEPTTILGKYKKWSSDMGMSIAKAGASLIEGAIGDATLEDVPFGGMAASGVNMFQVKTAADRFRETGDEASRVILDNYFTEQKEKQKKRDDSFFYSVGEGIRSSVTFGAELAVAMGLTVSTGVGAASFAAPLARKTVKESAKKYLETLLADKVFLEAVEKGFGQYAVKKAGQGIAIGTMTAGGHVPAGTLERMIGDPAYDDKGVLETISKGQDLPDAIVNSISQNVVEVASEFTGGVYGVLAKPTKQLLVRTGIIKAVQNKLKTTPSTAASVIKRMGWSGVFGETMEELHGKGANAILAELGLGDQEWEPLTMREVAQTILTVGFINTGMRATQSAFDSIEQRKRAENEEKVKNEMEKSGFNKDVRNMLETNDPAYVSVSLQESFGVDENTAQNLIRLAQLPSQNEVAKSISAVRDEVTRSIAITRKTTDEIIDRTEEIYRKASKSTAEEIADLEDELKEVQAMQKELAKRVKTGDQKAELGLEAIKMLPAPKDTKMLTPPADIAVGDSVTIKTNVTGAEREADVVAVRDDGIVAVVKNDPNFPPVPMVYPSEHFYAKPAKPSGLRIVKQTKEEMLREKSGTKAAPFVTSDDTKEKIADYREKAEKAKKSGSEKLARMFTEKADELEGKKPEKKPKETSSTTKKERTDAIVKAEAWRRGDKYSVVYEFEGTTVQKRGFKTEEEANAWINENATRSDRRQKIYEDVSKVREAPQKPEEKIEKEKPAAIPKISKEDEEHLFETKKKPAQDQVVEPNKMVVDSSVETLLKTHDETVENLRTGNITPEALKEAFANIVARESDIKAWLNKMTIAELNKKFPSYWQRPGAKKADVVENAYDTMLASYNPSDTVSYNMSETYSKAIARYVSSVTPEQIAEYAKKVAERRAERIARLEEKKQAIKDPQTLEQFQTFIEYNGANKMSDEQRIRYDALIADKIKADTEKAIQQKALVKGVNAGVGFEMKQTKHTKTGADLFVVTMGARVEKEVYSQLNSAAKRLGGYYSSFRGSGAIPGFQFKTAEDAQTFMQAGQGENVDAGAKMEERAQEQKSKTTNKLAALADTLEERATEKLNQDRKTNTAKRAREASGAEADARADIQLARTMRNLAGAIESGRAKYLDGISAKTHIEELESALRQAKWKQRNLVEGKYRRDHKDDKELLYDPSNVNQKNWGTASLSFKAQQEINRLKEAVENGPVTDETISAIEDIFPEFVGGNLVTDIIEPASKKAGFKMLAKRYMKIIPKGDKRWSPKSFQQVNDIADMSKAVDATGMYMYGIERAQRLQRMGVVSTPQFRAMLREYVTFRGDAVEEDKAKELERALVGAKVGFDFFATAPHVVKTLVEDADIRPGMKVLEPSAGNGNIATGIREAGVEPDVIELSSQLRDVLTAKGFNVVGQDFMDHTDGGYDAIVMNPPFGTNDDIAHVKHAYDLLAPGGKLVSIVGEGAFFRSGKTEVEFRNWLDTVGADVSELPPDAFNDPSLLTKTSARGRKVVIEKPDVSFARKDETDEQLRDAVIAGLNEVSSQDVITRGKGVDLALMKEIENLQEGFELGKDTAEDVNRAAEILASMGKLKEFMQLDFARKDELTNKIKSEMTEDVAREFPDIPKSEIEDFISNCIKFV